jgi:hypothetical protein
MWPLATEQRIDLDRLARDRDAPFVRRAGERREAAAGLFVVGAVFVFLVRQVDGIQAVEITRLALQALDDLAEVARQDGVARHFGLPGGVESPGGAGQVRRTADAAGAWCDDQAGLRVLVAQDHFEAAEQFGLRPGVDDVAVADVDTDVEVALDAADRGDVECLYGHGGAFDGLAVFRTG